MRSRHSYEIIETESSLGLKTRTQRYPIYTKTLLDVKLETRGISAKCENRTLVIAYHRQKGSVTRSICAYRTTTLVEDTADFDQL